MRLNLIMGLVDKITGPILKVTDTTSRMGEKIKATQSELSRLGNTSKDIEHFKALEARTGQTAQALALAQSKAQALGQQLNATANPTRKMTDEFTRAAEQVKRLQAQQQSERLELQRTGQQLAATGVNTGRLSEATRRIEAQTRRYNEQLAKEQKALSLVAEKQKRLGEIKQRNSDMKMSATGDAIGVGVAIAGAKQLVDAYGEVVTARNDGLALGLDEAGIDSITAKAKEFSNMWSGTTQKEFIDGAVEIKSAIDTLGAEAIGDFTKIAALVAKSTKSTTAEMTSLMSTGYGVYRRQFDDFGKAVVAGWDKMSAEERDIEFGKYFAAGLVETVNVFKSDGQQMSAALTNLGATATSANIPFAEQLAILGQLQLTMSGSEAATKYRSFIGAAAGASEKLGVSFMDANDKLLSMPAILEVLRKKYGATLDAMETQEMKKAFGTDEAIALIQLLYPEIDSLKKNISGMGEALKTGMSTTERMAQIMNSGPNESFKLMSQRIQNASVTLGAVFAPAMMFAAGAVGQLASLIGSLAERFSVSLPGDRLRPGRTGGPEGGVDCRSLWFRVPLRWADAGPAFAAVLHGGQPAHASGVTRNAGAIDRRRNGGVPARHGKSCLRHRRGGDDGGAMGVKRGHDGQPHRLGDCRHAGIGRGGGPGGALLGAAERLLWRAVGAHQSRVLGGLGVHQDAVGLFAVGLADAGMGAVNHLLQRPMGQRQNGVLGGLGVHQGADELRLCLVDLPGLGAACGVLWRAVGARQSGVLGGLGVHQGADGRLALGAGDPGVGTPVYVLRYALGSHQERVC
jgi:TP901 family phage tail tape measure protein